MVSLFSLKNFGLKNYLLGRERRKAHFYVYCPSPCKNMQPGKLRVRCASCRSGAFTVDRDPQCWEDVLQNHRISGTCEDEVCQVCIPPQRIQVFIIFLYK